MFLDVPQHEEGVAEINTKTRHNPSILELKPNVVLGYPDHSHHHPEHSHHHPEYSHHHLEHSHHQKYLHEISPPDLSKFYHSGGNHGKYGEMNEGEYYSQSNTHESVGPYRSPSFYDPYKNSEIISSKIKKVPLKLITSPGLKHYATYPKFSSRTSRPDYSSYFRSRQIQVDEQRDASRRMVQSMQKRSPQYMAPRYANGDSNYFS